jgi:hypothetical protein
MSSTLEQLNTYSSSTITYTDNRLPGIKISYPTARDIPNVIKTSNTFLVQRSIDILEIIDPDGTLNLTYSIDLSSVPGASLTWVDLFSGSITSVAGQVYSVRAIQNVSHWELVRAPEITLPETFQGDFEYTCTLTYLTDTGVETVSWTVGTFVPVSNLSAEVTFVSEATKFKGIVNEEYTANFSLQGAGIPLATINPATFNAITTVNANVERSIRGFEAVMSSNSNLTAELDLLIANAVIDRAAQFTVDVEATKIDFVNNIDVQRTFLSNVENKPFNTNLITFNNTIEPNLTVTDAVLNLSNSTGGTFNGITDQSIVINQTGINAISSLESAMANISYYPPVGATTGSTYNLNVRFTFGWIDAYGVNKFITKSYNVEIVYNGVGDYAGDTLTFNVGTHTWTPTLLDKKYGEMRYLLVAGGGGSAPSDQYANSAGGGAGGYYEQSSHEDIINSSYSITVGSGGTTGSSGTLSSFNGITVQPGTAGILPNNTQYPLSATDYGKGGDSGNGFTGGDTAVNTGGSGTPWSAGGGAGGTQNGEDGTFAGFPPASIPGDGGNGFNSTVYGEIVSVGGGGEGGLYDAYEAPDIAGNGGNGFGSKRYGSNGILRIRVTVK